MSDKQDIPDQRSLTAEEKKYVQELATTIVKTVAKPNNQDKAELILIALAHVSGMLIAAQAETIEDCSVMMKQFATTISHSTSQSFFAMLEAQEAKDKDN